MVDCADTSFLFSLYGNDSHSPRARAWVLGRGSTVAISELADFELANAFRLAEFQGLLAKGEAAIYQARYDADRAAGLVAIPPVNLAGVVTQAKRLSATHTSRGGHRGFDIIHVAAALEMSAAHFLTFDAKQKKLALAEGLDAPL